MTTNTQRVFDLLATQPAKDFPTAEIVAKLNSSADSITDALAWLRRAKKIIPSHDHTTGRRGPHWQYRIAEGATRPADGRGHNNRNLARVSEKQH